MQQRVGVKPEHLFQAPSPAAEPCPEAQRWRRRPPSAPSRLCSGPSTPKCPAWQDTSEVSQPVKEVQGFMGSNVETDGKFTAQHLEKQNKTAF